MATAAFRTPTGVPIMNNLKPTLKPELVEIVRQVHALRTITKKTGFITNRSIGVMLSKLSQPDLVAVGEALQMSAQDFEHYLRSR
jgi:wyosine [tRNA(Phe)-imidazoG37] synthetase (radical SAM superfamily)